MAPVAYMLGARVIEKHFTASHTAKGTDHAFSLMPEGMRKLVRDLRRVPAAIGDGVKRPLPSEEAPLRKMGKQLVAARPLPAGHVLAEGDLVAKSPAEGGLPPYRAGRPARPRARAGARRRRGDPGGRRHRCRPGRVRGSAVNDPLFDLTGRVAVVTGGMGQLGAELAVALATRGMRVAILDLETTPRSGAPGLVTALEEGTVRAHACDVTDRAQVEAALALVEVDWGVPDLLVNAAAIDAPPDAPAEEVGPFEDVPVESLERVVHVNVLGVVVPLPGDRRRDGARRQGLDRQRRLGLRAPLARPGPLRLPSRGR